jgi:cytochrome c oxidase cbb3-type subunit 3
VSSPEPKDPAADKVVHVYDDIQEEDNLLPNWWLFILFGSMVFAFGYWFVYQTTQLLPNPGAVYQGGDRGDDRRAHQAATRRRTEALMALAHDPSVVDAGHGVFNTMCSACHGKNAEGIIGPNLTDRYWIHGGQPGDILKSMTEGYPEKGMPQWGRLLGDEEDAPWSRLRALGAQHQSASTKQPRARRSTEHGRRRRAMGSAEIRSARRPSGRRRSSARCAPTARVARSIRRTCAARWIVRRRLVFAALMAFYVLAPLVPVGGHPSLCCSTSRPALLSLRPHLQCQDFWMVVLFRSPSPSPCCSSCLARARHGADGRARRRSFSRGLPADRAFFDGPRERRLRAADQPLTAGRVLRSTAKHLCFLFVSINIAHAARRSSSRRGSSWRCCAKGRLSIGWRSCSPSGLPPSWSSTSPGSASSSAVSCALRPHAVAAPPIATR